MKKTQRIALAIIIFFIVAGIFILNSDKSMFNQETTLAIQAKAENLTCPKLLNKTTRLDSVSWAPGKKYLIHLTQRVL